MTTDKTASQAREKIRIGVSWRYGRKLQRQSQRVYAEIRLAVIKLDALEELGELALAKLTALSKEETERGQAYPVGAERFEYLIDKVAQSMGVEVDELSRRWKIG